MAGYDPLVNLETASAHRAKINAQLLELYTDITLLNNIFADTKEPTGFPCDATGQPDVASSAISFVVGTRTFTITPTGTSYYYYYQGTKVTQSVARTVVIGDVEGLHLIYFDSDGLLHETQTIDYDHVENKVLVAWVLWDFTNKTAFSLLDERHGMRMDGATHWRLHNHAGYINESGALLADFVTGGNGSLASHAQFSISQGVFIDEDLRSTLAAVTSTTGIPVMYKSGVNGYLRFANNAGFPVITTGTGRLAYNPDPGTGNPWALVEADNNSYLNFYVIATNAKTTPYIMLMAQTMYGTLSAARTALPTDINAILGRGIGLPEIYVIGGMILHTINTASNAVKANIEAYSATTSYWNMIKKKLNNTYYVA
jgi:hypothetical protein